MKRTEIIDTSTPESTLITCQNYIQSRKSCYEFRSIRYEAVFEMLNYFGLNNNHTVIDVGAGDGEFGKYLYNSGFRGNYIPVDGMIDGTDLNKWIPTRRTDFFVAIEVIEHLENPIEMLRKLKQCADNAVVVTTPNPVVVNVKAMDKTHISEIRPEDFYKTGYKVVPQIFFFEPEDSLLGWWKHE
jgi:2-polyprenyl-3-methyl-5-hydroxy-6-metoxy-1,4-benzoquinol methylase